MFFREALCLNIFNKRGVVIPRDYLEAIKDETCMRSRQ